MELSALGGNTFEHASMRPAPMPGDDVIAYVHFFFAVVVGRLGAFRFATRPEDALWIPGTDEKKIDEFTALLSPLRFIETAPDGRLELRGTVIFKDALFITSVMVASNWELELQNEELLLENLPIASGPRIDLLVTR